MIQSNQSFAAAICVATMISLALAATPSESQKTPATQPAGRKDIGVEEFDRLRNEKKYPVLDVRTAKEFEAGHIPGAINLDISGSDFDKKLSELKKDQPYLVNCAIGARSAKACDKMVKMDFQSVYNLEGGIKAWQRAGKPVEK